MPVEFEEQFRLQLPGVLANKERDDQVLQDRAEIAAAVCQRHPFGPVLRTHMNELVAILFQKADRVDDQRGVQRRHVEHGSRGGGIQGCGVGSGPCLLRRAAAARQGPSSH